MKKQLTEYSSGEDFAELLVGKWVGKTDDDRLVLSDGTRLIISPNEGCGGCSSGWYGLDLLNGVENVITSVEFIEETEGYDDHYRLFVYAGGVRTEMMHISGSVGNGYYGSGFTIDVVREVEE